MAKLDSPLYGEEATGKVADVLYYRRTTPYPQIYQKRVVTVPPTTAQNAQRWLWLEGCEAWRALTPGEQAEYNASIVDLKSGFNLFMRIWFTEHLALLGLDVFGQGIFEQNLAYHYPIEADYSANFPASADTWPAVLQLYDTLASIVYNFLAEQLVVVEEYLIIHKTTIEQE